MKNIKIIFKIFLLVTFLSSLKLYAQCDLPEEFDGNTGVNMTVLFTSDVVEAIEETVSPESFYVVAKTSSGLVVGSSAQVVNGAVSIAVWGDDTLTPEVDGATSDESIILQVVSGSLLFDVEISSALLNFAPVTELTYITNGIASVTGITITEVICQVEGCTNETACNYNADATVNDESCVYVDGVCDTCVDGVVIDNDADDDGICDADELSGCMDSLACNYNALANEDDGTCTFAEENYDCNGDCLNDVNNNDICDETEMSGCTDETACNYNENATLASSCIYLSMGGPCATCSGETDGSGTLITNDDDNDNVCNNDEITGCMNPTACNYDSTATDAGTCEFAMEFYDCEGSCIEDTDGDGVCDSLEIYGCTDMNYFEYDSLATELDMDACVTMIVYGCMDPMYLEYNENANMDTDPTMCINLILEGCTDMEACNYNELANVDDGTCYSISVELSEYSYEHQMITATVTGAMDAAYAWTLDGNAIENNTNEVIPVENGTYVLIVTDGLCSETLTTEVNSVGIEELSEMQLEVYPNPAIDKLHISVGDSYGTLQVKVLNSAGAVVVDKQFTNLQADELILLDVEELPIGLYMLKVFSNTKTTTIPWMKQ